MTSTNEILCPVCTSTLLDSGGFRVSLGVITADTMAARVCQYVNGTPRGKGCINSEGDFKKGDAYGRSCDKWSSDEELLNAYSKAGGIIPDS